jgi:arylsulfatase A-like enzyme
LELAGVAPDPMMQGASMVALLRGDTDESPRDHALVELREDVEGLQSRTIVTQRYKLACYPGHEFGELFDLAEDPGEERNLWEKPAQAATREALLRMLVGEMADSARPVLPRVSYA